MKTAKNLLLSVLVLFFLPKGYAQVDSIRISGVLKGLKNNAVWIAFTDDKGVPKSYKANATNDAFTFKVPKMELPVSARFDVSINRAMSAVSNEQNITNPAPVLDLFVYNKDIEINGEALLVQLADVTGDEENNVFNTYKGKIKADSKLNYEITLALFNANYFNKPLVTEAKILQEEALAARKRIQQQQKDFINVHPAAFAAIFLLARAQNIYNANDYTNAWTNLANRYKDHPAAINIKSYVKKVSSMLAGATAVPFEKIAKDGKTINLEAYKGRIVLLDFWGSWCGPCRASHPHLKTIYDKYQSKGFEIIAIAQERGKTIAESKKNWFKAIEEDQINWVHLLNQDGIDKQDIVKNYNINTFPTKILLDDHGKIILRISASATDDIDKALEKIYGF